MIDPWTWPLSWIVRGLALAVASGAFYLIVRRAGPIVGVTASATGLVLLAVLPFLLLVPGPRWDVPIGSRLADLGSFTDLGDPPEPSLPPQLEELALSQERLPNGSTEPRQDRSAQISPASGSQPTADFSPDPSPAPDSLSGLSKSWRSAVAMILAALVAMSLVRLIFGIGAVARLRSRGEPIHDPSLADLRDLLRAELSITRTVELREASGLGPPATIGWRRPVVLLPDDWRSWDAAEVRAVLAHELSHIHRADFLVAFLAQLGVALHPYNPIAYWLAGRLRLDQELAADASAAQLSGGRRAYLTCLARLALRRDDHASGGPARAFLPVRGTLVRRIEMLRSERSPDRDAPSRASRGLTIASISALALLCVGLQAPEPAQARPQDNPAAEAAPLGSDGFDLSPVPADAAFVAAIRPARLATQPEIQDLIDEFDPMGQIFGGIDLPVSGLEQVTVVEMRRMEPPPRRGSMPIVPDLIIVRTVDPVGDELISNILKEFETVSYLGTRYQRARGARLTTFRFDPQTLIISQSEQTLRYLIAERNRPNASPLWLEAAGPVNAGQLLLAFETPWLTQLVGPPPARGAGPFGPLALIGPMLDRASAYAISLDLFDGVSITGLALCGDEEGATQVSETATAFKTLGRNALNTLQERVTEPDAGSESSFAVLNEIETLLNAVTISADGSTVRLQAETDQDLSAIMRLAMEPINVARIASRRTQSTNNLKMIALALHNYHDVYGHFPPPVLYAEDGTPYSWRVALLPFLEQAPLYNEYRMNEPWDSPNNRKLLEQMPSVYRVPGSESDPTHADYFALVGPMSLMGMPGKGTNIAKITDGTSNTLAIVETKRPIPWTQPEDIRVSDPSANPNELVVPEFGGFWPEGFQAAFGDGSVRFLSFTINPDVLRALITKSGGEVIRAEID
ncbi:M56 family metallopeptidase [Tautonia marina]|uniref:M56 family metallopeptidase n=1 Tax=Tautonia marina TaxID=2653855 RepID=UPI0012608BAC|nr:M56 family metallopeptidase [Tautonia marina]